MNEISLSDFMRDAVDLAHRAISQDKMENYEVAVYFYRESISLLVRSRIELVRRISLVESASDGGVNEDVNSTTLSTWKEKLKVVEFKIHEYQGRINELEKCKFCILV